MDSKYSSLKEWKSADPKAYIQACIKGYLEEICNKFGWVFRKSNGYWTKERCLEEARKHPNTTAWKKASKGSYSAAQRNGWFEECSAHIIPIRKSNWTKERILEEARKHTTMIEWRKASKGSYNAAQRNGWLEECSAHFIPMKKPRGYWTKERCIEEARKYNTINAWRKASVSSYDAAQRNGWLEEIKMLGIFKQYGV